MIQQNLDLQFKPVGFYTVFIYDGDNLNLVDVDRGYGELPDPLELASTMPEGYVVEVEFKK